MSVLQPNGDAIINGRIIPASDLKAMMDQADRGEFAGKPGQIFYGLPPHPSGDGRTYAVAVSPAQGRKLASVALDRNTTPALVLSELIDAL